MRDGQGGFCERRSKYYECLFFRFFVRGHFSTNFDQIKTKCKKQTCSFIIYYRIERKIRRFSEKEKSKLSKTPTLLFFYFFFPTTLLIPHITHDRTFLSLDLSNGACFIENDQEKGSSEGNKDSIVVVVFLGWFWVNF